MTDRCQKVGQGTERAWPCSAAARPKPGPGQHPCARARQDVLKLGAADLQDICRRQFHPGLVRAFGEAGIQIAHGILAGHTGGTVEAVAAAAGHQGYERLLHVIDRLGGAPARRPPAMPVPRRRADAGFLAVCSSSQHLLDTPGSRGRAWHA